MSHSAVQQKWTHIRNQLDCFKQQDQQLWDLRILGAKNSWVPDMTEWLNWLTETFRSEAFQNPVPPFPPLSVQFICSVVSGSLWPHGLQHSRLPCPSPTPGVYSNSCPLSRWCYPTISSSVIPFSSCLNFSQHQGFSNVSSWHQKAKVLEF